MIDSTGSRRPPSGLLRVAVLAAVVFATVSLVFFGATPESAVAVTCAGGLGAAEIASRLLGPAGKDRR